MCYFDNFIVEALVRIIAISKILEIRLQATFTKLFFLQVFEMA